MAKMTLLEMVQNILNAIDGDDVNSIDDTEESEQVALIVKETYFETVGRYDWPWLKLRTNLTGLADVSNPTKMLIPATLNKIYWVKYAKNDVSYLDPKEFQDLLDARDTDASNVDANGYVTDANPLWWTSFDDQYIYFDAYDSDTESTLSTANAVVYGLTSPSWTHEDSFTPDAPEKYFPTLLAEAKSVCFVNLRQQASSKEEQRAVRGFNRMRSEAWKNEKGEVQYGNNIDYGRK